MATDLIRYDLLVQDALRSVVRKVLADTARSGLAGDHHFNIAFKTQAPGVVVPPGIRQRFPDEMSIILQHEFWDLTVSQDTFEVSLNFSRRPERLTVPFDAITGFTDPSVPFGFKLEPRVFEAPSPSASPGPLPASAAKLAPVRSDSAKSDTPKSETAKSETARFETTRSGAGKSQSARPEAGRPDTAKPQLAKSKSTPELAPVKSGGSGAKPADPAPDAKVVSIDAFRKK